MNTIKRVFLNPLTATATVFATSIAFSMMANAQTKNPTPPNPVNDQSQLQTVLCNIIAWFFWIVIIVSVLMILYAAFTYATAGSNTEKTSQARRTITFAAIGIAVALLAYGFPSIVSDFFQNTNGGTVSFQCIGQ
ncbi:MAG TPA: pilin [Candidatus Paceibacterota bacterium]|nr:pilin [Candidatus Paceibacterota bacterium]